MKKTSPPCEIITLGENGLPEKVPYQRDVLTDFLACLVMVGFIALMFVLALWLAPRG